MPQVRRPGQPDIYFEIDDYSDPWKDAPYIMLQHGFGRSSRLWYGWVPYLSRFFKVVRPDLRGCGKSLAAEDTEGRKTLAGYMLRAPMSLQKMTYDTATGTMIYRSKMHAGLKHNF